MRGPSSRRPPVGWAGAALLAVLAVGCRTGHPVVEARRTAAGEWRLQARLGSTPAHQLEVIAARGVEELVLAVADADVAARFARSGREPEGRYALLARTANDGLQAVALVEVHPEGLWIAHPTAAGAARAVVVLPFAFDPPTRAATFPNAVEARGWLREVERAHAEGRLQPAATRR